MRFAFINNFEQILAQAVSDTDTTITLDGGGSELDNASKDLVYVLTLFHVDSNGNETEREIVHVTGAEGDVLTVERAQEGTTAQAWPVGDGVSQRLTAGVLGGMHQQADGLLASVPSHDEFSVMLGDGVSIAEGIQYSVVLGTWAQATNDYAGFAEYMTALGPLAQVDGEYAVAVGAAGAWGDYAIAIGREGWAGKGSVAIGHDAWAGIEGWGDGNLQESSIAIGRWCYVNVTRSIGIGADVDVEADHAIAVGDTSSARAAFSVALGRNAETADNAEEGLAIGHGAISNVAGGLRISALSYLPASTPAPTGSIADNSTRQSTQQVVIATDLLDLTDDTAAVTLDLPANTILLIDAIDVVIVGSDGAGGSPEIQVGPDDQDPADYLASTPVTKTAVGGRESHDLLVADGVTSLRVATAVAGTGTTYQAKVVFRGYVMEL